MTPAGKNIPIDVKPSANGNLVLRVQAGDDGVEVLDEPMLALNVSTLLREELQFAARDEPRFISHFATCPHAAEHRKPKQEQL